MPQIDRPLITIGDVSGDSSQTEHAVSASK